MDVDRLVWEGQVGIAIAFAMPWAISGALWAGLQLWRRWRHD